MSLHTDIVAAFEAAFGGVPPDTTADIAEAVADSIAPPVEAAITAAAGSGGHNVGALVNWTHGTGPGQYNFGAAAPNGSIVSISGCDEGGRITFTAGANTSNGVVFEIYFAVPFDYPPAGVVVAEDANAGHLFFVSEWRVNTTTDKLQLLIAASSLANQQYSFFWTAKGFA